MVWLLAIAVAFAALFSGWAEAVAILLVLTINTLIGLTAAQSG